MEVIETKQLDTSIAYQSRALKENKFQNLIIDKKYMNQPRPKESIIEDTSIFESNFRTAVEEKAEMQKIYQDLFDNSKSYEQFDQRNKERRIDVHLKLTRTNAFTHFAQYAMQGGSSCNLEIYEKTFQQFDEQSSHDPFKDYYIAQEDQNNLHL